MFPVARNPDRLLVRSPHAKAITARPGAGGFEQVAELQISARHVEALVRRAPPQPGPVLALVRPGGERAALEAEPAQYRPAGPGRRRACLHDRRRGAGGKRLAADARRRKPRSAVGGAGGHARATVRPRIAGGFIPMVAWSVAVIRGVDTASTGQTATRRVRGMPMCASGGRGMRGPAGAKRAACASVAHCLPECREPCITD